MRRVFRKGMAVALAAAMVVTLAPASADAAKKPSIAKKASVKVGKSTKIKVKNGKAKATVTWKTSKKSVAKLGKQVKKGNKASVVVKGVKKGKATITATYKLGKKKTKLKCVVTVSGTTTPAAATTAPAAVATATATAAAPTATATANPTEAPTKAPSPTPKPSPTPSPRPKNTNLDAYGLSVDTEGKETAITVDGVIDGAWEDCRANDLLTDITKESGVRKGTSKVTAAKASILWGKTSAYVLVEVTKDKPDDTDSVTIYFSDKEKASAADVKKATIKAGENGKSTKTDKGYIVEAKFDCSVTGTESEDENGNVIMTYPTASIEVQINEGNVTTNYYDTRSAMICGADGVFNLGDEEVTVDKDPAKMGQLTLLAAMPKSKLAYKTADGEAIRKAADIDNGTWDVEAGEDGKQAVTAKKVKFVDTKFWTDVYGANDPVVFTNCNPSAYAPEGRKSDNISLMKKVEGEDGKVSYVSDADLAKGYVIWDEDYLYVLFDIADKDVTKNDTESPYLCDSTEFFFDEDNSKPTTYTQGDDEVQIRVAAIDGAYSSNEFNTGNYTLVAHASNVIEGVGYQTEYIIKFNKKHSVNDIMGMDLQVNDCETVAAVVDEETGEVTSEETTARACTITAYDTTNNDYQDPSCFGRVKLIDRTVEGGDDTPGGDTPGEVVTGDALVALDLSTGKVMGVGAEKTDNEDGTITGTNCEGFVFELPESYQIKGAESFYIRAEFEAEGSFGRIYLTPNSDACKSNQLKDEENTGVINDKLTAEDAIKQVFFKTGSWGQKFTSLTIKSIQVSKEPIAEPEEGGNDAGDETPGDETPGDETPGDETPGDETPGDETPGDETPGDETPGDETPGDETPGEGENDESVLKMDITKFASNENVTVTKNDDGSVTLDWAETAADWSDIKLLFDAPKDLSGYTKYIVKTKGAAGEKIFCASILDAEKKSKWGAPASVGLKYEFPTNTELTLDSLKNADYNEDVEGGTDGDYTNVLGISFNKNNKATAVSVTITDIEFIK